MREPAALLLSKNNARATLQQIYREHPASRIIGVPNLTVVIQAGYQKIGSGGAPSGSCA